MEKITQGQSADLQFKCCFFGAIRGENGDGKEVGLISHVYSHRNDFSHKDFECSFYGSISKDDSKSKSVSFNDPEVWKMSTTDEIFKRREEIIEQYQIEGRDIVYCEIEEIHPC
ncbi:MAG: hypothetical protein AAFN93_02350 [Bacteroidota bacterium]